MVDVSKRNHAHRTPPALSHSLPAALSHRLLDHLLRSQGRWSVRGVRGPFPGGGGGFYLHSSQRKKSQKSTFVTCPQVRVLSLLRMWFLEPSPQFVVGCPLNVFLCTCGSYHCFLAGQTATYCINCRILFLDNRPKGSYVSIYVHFQGKSIWPSG